MLPAGNFGASSHSHVTLVPKVSCEADQLPTHPSSKILKHVVTFRHGADILTCTLAAGEGLNMEGSTMK